MILFVNNIPLNIAENTIQISNDFAKFDAKFDLHEDLVEFTELSGQILIKNIDNKNLLRFISYLQKNKIEGLRSIVFMVSDEAKTKKELKKNFIHIKAAGGIATNDKDEKLLIKRLGFWDLPKGKLDKGEGSKIAAIREVEEECGVKAKLGEKVCTTFHTYTYKNVDILKQTKWYSMDLLNDSKMKPQVEEDIEKLEWMNKNQVKAALINSYSSIRYVLKKYYDK
jgi:8-oxo-dGTP pyrophosphatase MutT (NUDIX family)